MPVQKHGFEIHPFWSLDILARSRGLAPVSLPWELQHILSLIPLCGVWCTHSAVMLISVIYRDSNNTLLSEIHFQVKWQCGKKDILDIELEGTLGQ